MRVSANEKLISNRRRLGTYASVGGLVVLGLGMLASIRNFWWISLIALVVGFVLAQFGTYNLRRWGRSPRPDEVLKAGLKGFDDRYHFYAWTLPVPFVLLGPQGVYSFITRDQAGQVTVNGAQWRSKFSIARVLTVFAQEGMGNPTTEALDNAAKLKQWIERMAPELAPDVQPVVVFIDYRAELTVNEPTVPVLDAKGVKKYLRGPGKGDAIKSADFKALEALFDARASEVSS